MAHGGRREGAGRKPGAVNQVTKDIRAMAREHAVEALATLVEIMRDGKDQSLKKDAAKDLLDRGFGKPGQHIELDADVKQDVLITAIELVGRKEI